MEVFETILLLSIYVLLIVLLIIGIILGIRLIQTLNKVDKVVDDVEEKVRALDGLFDAVDVVSDKFSLITNRLVDGIGGIISKIFKKSHYDDEFEEEDE